MNRDRRRALTAAWKERKARPGVFAVRCTATGETWIGRSAELANRQNSVWFSLRLGSHPNRAMLAAWKAHGEAAFAYEELEALDPDLEGWLLEQALKDAVAAWRDRLGAGQV